MIDINKIKAAAIAATPGPWHSPGLGEVHDDKNDCVIVDVCWQNHDDGVDSVGNGTQADADYIATANPAAVLELITQLEAAELELKQCSRLLDDAHRSLEAAERDAARYKTLQDMSGICYNYSAEYQLIGQLDHYVDAIKPQVDKAISAMKESK